MDSAQTVDMLLSPSESKLKQVQLQTDLVQAAETLLTPSTLADVFPVPKEDACWEPKEFAGRLDRMVTPSPRSAASPRTLTAHAPSFVLRHPACSAEGCMRSCSGLRARPPAGSPQPFARSNSTLFPIGRPRCAARFQLHWSSRGRHPSCDPCRTGRSGSLRRYEGGSPSLSSSPHDLR